MAKAKTKSAYVCDDCGAEHGKWQGQCSACGAWNTLSRVNITPVASASVAPVMAARAARLICTG